nr:helix-turn-helix domain-containing protein [Candidatus Saccharibacteria bacterium]
MSQFKHITKIERLEIGILIHRGYTIPSSAIELGRHHSTIYREIQRNTVAGEYTSTKAHHKAYVRRKYSKYQA